MAQLEKQTNIFVRMLNNWLSLCLRQRTPSGRSDLLPGFYWTWYSLIVPLFKSACLMLLSDLRAANFVNRKDYESLLGNGGSSRHFLDPEWKADCNE